mgnify:CR=1 FL=1
MKKINLSHLDLEMYYDKINNLEVYVVPNNKGEGNYAVLTTKYGSIDNKFILDGKEIITPQGVAHFLEHKMFESENGTDPFNFYAEKGADANASTSYFKTSYLFSGSDNFEENLKFLLEYTNKPYFTDENIEKEQGIIGEEIKMVRDDPYRRMYEEIMSNVFINHPIKNSVIGTKESIASVTKEDLYKVYNSFFLTSGVFNAFFMVLNNYITSAFPPKASIFSLADFVNLTALTLTFLSNFPVPRITMPSLIFPIIPSSTRVSAVMFSAFALDNIVSVTSVKFLAWMFVNPLFGNLLNNGVWPPSNPRLTPPPDLAFWPLCPLPDVLPRPDPIPRPTLVLFVFFCAGFSSSNFISQLHLQFFYFEICHY